MLRELGRLEGPWEVCSSVLPARQTAAYSSSQARKHDYNVCNTSRTCLSLVLMAHTSSNVRLHRAQLCESLLGLG